MRSGVTSVTLQISVACLAEGTPILVADGTSVAIETLRPGMVLAAPNGGTTTVQALHVMRVPRRVFATEVLWFAPGALGAGTPNAWLGVTPQHGCWRDDACISFGDVATIAGISGVPEGLSDTLIAATVGAAPRLFQVVVEGDVATPICAAGVFVSTWTADHPHRAFLPQVC